jgi:hexosaminidase
MAALPAVVPLPRSVEGGTGAYQLPTQLAIRAATADERNVANFLIAFLKTRGVAATIASSASPAQITLNSHAHDQSLKTDGYRLHAGTDGIAIAANGGAGLYYGLQTLEQLMPQGTTLDATDITDWPAFGWRGIHLDVSRHFYPVSVLERYIDIASHYKLNVFHWHLTDDQGWRIQIKRYPRLTSVGSCRAGTEIDHDATTIDNKRYCGFYTQDQIRQVVAYAAKRYLTIVP